MKYEVYILPFSIVVVVYFWTSSFVVRTSKIHIVLVPRDKWIEKKVSCPVLYIHRTFYFSVQVCLRYCMYQRVFAHNICSIFVLWDLITPLHMFLYPKFYLYYFYGYVIIACLVYNVCLLCNKPMFAHKHKWGQLFQLHNNLP